MPYSHREDFELPANSEPIFHQPFTREEWEASNFAPASSIAWFRDARYGMFVHFGLSTFKNQDLSWGICHTRKAPDTGHGPYPDAEWQSWVSQFNLEKFDAREWVRIAQDAGFRYLVLITKHHDGFHMWDTDESDFKITNTPFGRDVVREVVDACHETGMPVGLYYSQRDWYHPDYMPVDPGKVKLNGNNWTLNPGETSPMGACHDKYLAYQERAVRELCTRYGRIDIFWWDAAWWGGMFTAEMWDGENITRMIRGLQPEIVINNRCSVPGDFDTPEGRLGSFQNWRPWESCICLTGSWSYSATPAKPLCRLVRMLVSNACGDGNLLLSWGPHWDGEFDPGENARLMEVGAWLKQNGSTVFGTRGGPWMPGLWGGSVYRDNIIYLHVTELPGDVLVLPRLPGRTLLSVRLSNGRDVAFEVDESHLRLKLPSELRDPIDSIVALTMDQALADLTPIATSRQSVFNDRETFGSCVDERIIGSSGGHRPYVLDLGEELTVTGLRIEQSSGEPDDLVLTVDISADAGRWETKGKVSGPVPELAINGYHSGAWIHGCLARFIRVRADGHRATTFASRRCFVYGRIMR